MVKDTGCMGKCNPTIRSQHNSLSAGQPDPGGDQCGERAGKCPRPGKTIVVHTNTLHLK